MTRKDIIAVRRKLRVPEQFQGQWATLVDVGFDGDYISPIQKTSNSATGPVLVAKHWFDAESTNQHRATLERCGYLPDIPFNYALDRVLEAVGLTRGGHIHHSGVPFLAEGECRPTEASATCVDETLHRGSDPP